MVQRQFLEFKEESGIGDLLFVNISKPTKYRFYCRRDSWDDCYMVEFCSNSEDYHLYWGHNKQERRVIDATALLLPPMCQRTCPRVTPAGFGSANNLYLTYKREFGIAPSERLQQLRQEREMGRYKL